MGIEVHPARRMELLDYEPDQGFQVEDFFVLHPKIRLLSSLPLPQKSTHISLSSSPLQKKNFKKSSPNLLSLQEVINI